MKESVRSLQYIDPSMLQLHSDGRAERQQLGTTIQMGLHCCSTLPGVMERDGSEPQKRNNTSQGEQHSILTNKNKRKRRGRSPVPTSDKSSDKAGLLITPRKGSQRVLPRNFQLGYLPRSRQHSCRFFLLSFI